MDEADSPSFQFAMGRADPDLALRLPDTRQVQESTDGLNTSDVTSSCRDVVVLERNVRLTPLSGFGQALVNAK